MSLVEKALRKMQTAQVAVTERPNVGAAQRAADPAPEVARPALAVPPQAPSPPPLPTCRTDKVVAVNTATLRARGLLPYAENERRMTAEYRAIKRPVMAIARGRVAPVQPNGKVVMIASALPGEGKSFTSINLAFSLAMEKDTSVVLVDGDGAKSRVSRGFDVQDEPGLMDLLADETLDTASVVLPTTLNGLSLLPAGREASNATELLGSTRMEKIIAELLSRDPTRIVLFDSPPLLLTTESRALIAVAGQVLLVVRAGETTHSAAQDAIACIGEGKQVGLILNYCEPGANPFYYGYGEYGDAADGAADRR